MYFVKTPGIIKIFYQNVIFDIKGKEKTIYLTFDDGPDIDVTPDVLEILQKFNAKATFFCVGNKAVNHPELLEKIREMGHSIGNHSYSHIRGNYVTANVFYDDIEKCDMIINSKLFRPPYGKITRNQIEKLRSKYYLILWSVLPGDFDNKGYQREMPRQISQIYQKWFDYRFSQQFKGERKGFVCFTSIPGTFFKIRLYL